MNTKVTILSLLDKGVIALKVQNLDAFILDNLKRKDFHQVVL
jgi:hypothetical protein